MRGRDFNQTSVVSYLSPEDMVPSNHPLRAIRRMTDRALSELSRSFASLYSPLGRRSVPPEQLLRALLLQILYSVRSERLLIEQLRYNFLFRWFVGLSPEDPVWDPSQQKPGTFAERRHRAEVLRGRGTPGAGGRSVVGRAFHGGRNPAGGVGQQEELSKEGDASRARQ